MTRTVVLVGALDTKGREFAFVRDAIRRAGLNVLTVDFGVLGEPVCEPDISRAEVAAAGDGDLSKWQAGQHKDEAMATMAAGLTAVVRRLYAQGRLAGILGMGGSGGTSIATAAMRALPVGLPKLMLSTVASGDVGPYAGTKDITFMPSVIDVAGLNRISRRIFTNAAGAIAGMVAAQDQSARADGIRVESEGKPLIAATMFGNTTAAVDRARTRFEEAGLEVIVFHATGVGGRTMEDLVKDGQFQGVLDLTTTELADEVCGGVMSAGPNRGQAAPAAGIPVVLAPGCVDMANFGGRETVPSHYAHRTLYQWNPNVTLLRTSVTENRRIGEMLAAAANAGRGGGSSVAFIWPLRGFSMLDSPGGAFWDPEADRACYEAVREGLNQSVPLIEIDANINDPQFADRATEMLLDMIRIRTG